MSDLNAVRNRIKTGDDVSAQSYSGMALYFAANLLGMGVLLFFLWPFMRGNYSESNPNQMLYIQLGLVFGGLVIGIPAFVSYRQRREYADQLCDAIRDRNPDEIRQLIENEKSAEWVRSALERKPPTDNSGFLRVIAANHKQKEKCIECIATQKAEVQRLIEASDSHTVGVMSKKSSRIFWAIPFLIIPLVIMPGMIAFAAPVFLVLCLYIFIETGIKNHKMTSQVRELGEQMESMALFYCATAIKTDNQQIIKQILKKRAKSGDKSAEQAVKSMEMY